jgi:hypothetical protein
LKCARIARACARRVCVPSKFGCRAFARPQEAHRQSLAVAVSSHAHKDQEFIGAVSAIGNEDGGEI